MRERESTPIMARLVGLMKPIRYLYYRIYAWMLRMWGETDVPQFSALCLTTMLTWLNMLTIIDVIELLGFPILDSTLLEERFVLAFLFAWSLHLYMHLYRGERYKQIVREFEDEDAASHRRGTVAVLCYSVFSPVACFGLGMVVASMRS